MKDSCGMHYYARMFIPPEQQAPESEQVIQLIEQRIGEWELFKLKTSGSGTQLANERINELEKMKKRIKRYYDTH
jgi:hypothetical protein